MKKEKTGLEAARDEALTQLDNLDPTQDDYATTMKHIKTLSKLIAAEQPEKLSANTALVVAGNVLIAFTIVSYEQKNVISSKVKDFLNKSR